MSHLGGKSQFRPMIPPMKVRVGPMHPRQQNTYMFNADVPKKPKREINVN